ncbi:MAG TPA: hypothetical protein VEL76_30930 [Gemmataceae bacterium]|nr:hypothetical protein [Gemmataceae bacterium]
MKVLFIGEGPTDIGHSGMDPDRPRPATGPLAILARKVCPQIDADSLALRWVEIARFDPRGKKKGWEAKVAAAILLSARKFDCDGTICIADRDRQKERLSEMDAGLQRGLGQVGSEHAAVCGVAIESIEAWALGAPSALAAELEEEVKTIQREYRLKEVEQFCESSGKEEHRPKGLLERLAQLVHRSDGTDFRQAVAERTDISELEKNCQDGFKPFADALRTAFASPPLSS